MSITFLPVEHIDVISREDGSRFVPLPPGMWRPIAGGCSCSHCNGSPEAFWDTLAVPPTGRTYLVHAPEMQPKR